MIKKNNRAKTRSWSKSGAMKKSTKEDRQQLMGPKQA